MMEYRESWKGLATEETLAELVNITIGTSPTGSLITKSVDSSGVITGDIVRTFDLMITRPANIDPYLAGDVISGETLAKFTNVAKAAGYGVVITNIRAQTDDTGLAGKTININIYNDTVTNQVDNSAYSVSDPAKRVGYIPITFGTGSRASVGADMFTNMMLNPVTRDMYVIVETVDAFTPSAVSTNIRIFMECILTN